VSVFNLSSVTYFPAYTDVNGTVYVTSVSETTMVTLFCQILQEKEKTYFKQCF